MVEDFQSFRQENQMYKLKRQKIGRCVCVRVLKSPEAKKKLYYYKDHTLLMDSAIVAL